MRTARADRELAEAEKGLHWYEWRGPVPYAVTQVARACGDEACVVAVFRGQFETARRRLRMNPQAARAHAMERTLAVDWPAAVARMREPGEAGTGERHDG